MLKEIGALFAPDAGVIIGTGGAPKVYVAAVTAEGFMSIQLIAFKFMVSLGPPILNGPVYVIPDVQVGIDEDEYITLFDPNIVIDCRPV